MELILKKLKYTVPALAAGFALALTGCVNNAAEEQTDDVNLRDVIADVKVDEEAAAALPADIADKGTLTVGVNAKYPPNEYRDPDGKPIGFNVTLAEAVGAKLGLEIDWQEAEFPQIIPQIQGGAFDMGSSSFTDTLERQDSVTFIDYYSAGTMWVRQAGSDFDPADVCGKKISVQRGTVQDGMLTDRSSQCEAEGKDAIEIVKFDDQSKTTDAVRQDRAEAMAADSPVGGAAIANSDDSLEQVGEIEDAAPYGLIVGKDSGLEEAIQLAMQSLMDDGTYMKVLEQAGVEAGAFETAEINSVKE